MKKLITHYGYTYDNTLSIVENIKNTLELIKNSSLLKYESKHINNIKFRYTYNFHINPVYILNDKDKELVFKIKHLIRDVRRINDIDTNVINNLLQELDIDYKENELYNTKIDAQIYESIKQFQNNIGLYSLLMLGTPIALVSYPFIVGYKFINQTINSE